MAAVSHSLLVVQLDRQIAEMERRQIEAARQAWPPGATLQYGYSPTHETIAEDLKKQISGLRRKRERLAAGLDDEPATEKQALVAPPTHNAPPAKRYTADSADVESLAKFGNISPERARKILESKDGRLIHAIADGIMPPLVDYIEEEIRPLQTRIAELTGEISQVRDEFQAALSGTQKMTKTIRTRRLPSGELTADVFESKGDGSQTELEERVAALEALPRLAYRGVWDVHNQYNEADLVTHDGSMFHCNCSTRAKPGTNSDWVLCVKRGKDAKPK